MAAGISADNKEEARRAQLRASSRIQLDKRVNQLDDGAGEEVERDQVGDGNDGG
ncbi:hypothetical protein HMPREF9982_11872 [Staphylococcus epidermidis NIHLM021]|nr:hypothetical protein HMPREF9982_11872 [Staphylococcus epidermidis NIHLM021]